MSTIFIKSGGYYETPGVSVSGAISDVFDYNLSQFTKVDSAFRLDLQDGNYKLFMTGQQANGMNTMSRQVDVDYLTRQADRYGFSYFGYVTDSRAVVTQAELMRELAVIAVDPTSGKYITCITGKELLGNNIMPVLYCVKVCNDTYALILSAMARIDSLIASESDGTGLTHAGNRVVIANDGASMRDQYIDIKFKNVLKHFKNNDLSAGYSIYAGVGQTIEIDLFKEAPFITPEFKRNFQVSLDTNFSPEVNPNGTLSIKMPDVAQNGWLSITLESTPLYKEVSSREIKETLTFDFNLFVL